MDQLNDEKITSRHNKNQMLETLDEYDKTKGMTIKEFANFTRLTKGRFTLLGNDTGPEEVQKGSTLDLSPARH